MATTRVGVHGDRRRGWGSNTHYAAVLLCLLRVAIGFLFIWFIFEKAHTVFETLVVALLVLIYDSVRDGNSDFSRSSLEQRVAQGKQFLEVLRKCSRESNYQDETGQTERAEVIAQEEAKLRQLDIL